MVSGEFQSQDESTTGTGTWTISETVLRTGTGSQGEVILPCTPTIFHFHATSSSFFHVRGARARASYESFSFARAFPPREANFNLDPF